LEEFTTRQGGLDCEQQPPGLAGVLDGFARPLGGSNMVPVDRLGTGCQISNTALGCQRVDGSLDGAPHAASDCDNQSRRSPTSLKQCSTAVA
jgi:hypothetical protein